MRRIERLPESVVNRIAAGEVVQRPSAALKELLENSLDAGSTFIQVVIQGGGLELLQVTDDGHGIHRSDLPLLCERYATSKLCTFEELQHVRSFGFRGEALSSISYVARVTVTTMCRGDTLAWRCQYVDGQMQGEPKPCAGNPGTCIRAEKMFYNSEVRRRALNRYSEEYSRAVGVVSRYAMAFPHVGFSCRRTDGNSGTGNGANNFKCCVHFPKGSDSLSNIRLLHGNEVVSHLCEVRCGSDSSDGDDSTKESILGASGPAGQGRFLITGYTSDMTLPNRKLFLCVFVNNRLVDSAAVRRALDAVYGGVLVGGNRPFSVFFITVPVERVDVNIHPTKHEVCLLDEEVVISRLSECVRGALMASAARRQIDTRQVLSKAVALSDAGGQRPNLAMINQPSVVPGASSCTAVGGTSTGISPCLLVRVERQRGALDAFINRPQSSIVTKEEPSRNDGHIQSTKDRAHNGQHARDASSGAAGKVEGATDTQVVGTSLASARNVSDEVADCGVGAVSSCSSADEEAPLLAARGVLVNLTQYDVDDEDDGSEVEHTMEYFKRHKKEMQETVGLMSHVVGLNSGSGGSAAIKAEEDTGNSTLTGEGTRQGLGSGDVVAAQVSTGTAVLTSVSAIVSTIRSHASPPATALFENLVYVGCLDGSLFFAQSGTTLYVVDALRLVQCVVYQRIFLRWAIASLPASPQLLLEEPVRLTDLLHFALEHDVPPCPPYNVVGELAASLVSRMDRRLRCWRYMLLEYFAVEISDSGYLIALPLPMNSSWPPPPRSVPLFVWRLAVEVPYDAGEVECFTAIARHIAETLYGSSLHDSWVDGKSVGCAAPDDVPPLCDAIRFGLLPCATNMSFFTPPPDLLSNGTVHSVVSVEELFKVFERC
uniref:Putative mismatch repair protein MLH1 n=1 Tax=Trypanosoma congolense (strain IL3000) TaxID=1068625 RepID=G0UST5_TRYCI|nr:putative mismatch repair protein MLH1 [Trypanosoma congolense IL3000]